MRAVIASLAKGMAQLSDRAIWRVVVKSVTITLTIFAALSVALYFALVWALAAFGWSLGGERIDGFAPAIMAGLTAVVAFWFLFRVLALAVLQFFADEIVVAVEMRHYAHAAQSARALPLHRDIANSLRGIGRTLAVHLLALPLIVVLLFTGIGPALVLLAINAWLLGRELTDMAWLRHRDTVAANPVPRGERIALGAVIAAAMLVPVANLLAPIVGAAAGTHLAQHAIARQNKGKS